MTNTASSVPRIYTAGAMRDDGEYTEWRRSIEEDLNGLTFYHPEGLFTEHGGGTVNGAVSEDLAAIRAADGLVAYISETPQIGTITELLHAVHTGTPVLVMFSYGTHSEGQLSGKITSEEYDYEAQELRYPAKIDPVEILGHAPDHWFLVNYLVGDGELQSLRPREVEGDLPGTIQQWSGIREATVMAVPDEEKLPAAVYDWVESVFGVDTASSTI